MSNPIYVFYRFFICAVLLLDSLNGITPPRSRGDDRQVSKTRDGDIAFPDQLVFTHEHRKEFAYEHYPEIPQHQDYFGFERPTREQHNSPSNSTHSQVGKVIYCDLINAGEFYF